MTLEWILGTAVVIFGALIGYIVRKQDAAWGDTRAALMAHIQACDELPKSTILEKIEGLCEKQDTHYSQLTATLGKAETALSHYSMRTGEVEKAVMSIGHKVEMLSITKVDRGEFANHVKVLQETKLDVNDFRKEVRDLRASE